ncbi:MAG: ABC-ATPase UvrA [Haloplasmataceae bacterium]|jgi:excinuclease ABC subunit A|nr:ABC-ATPase UvrA [Haloplasmataceae bacterium]
MSKEQEYIVVKGARENNLKNIDITIPRGQFVVMTGLSGSGKSSLAFDTIYAEGQRRYIESLSVYARQFLGNVDKPDVDSIEGLSPAISIDQKSTNNNPRSTVGTVTEIYDYLRLLYARIGHPICPTHGVEIKSQSIDQMIDRILEYEERTKIQILAPVATGKKGTFKKEFDQLIKDGYVRVRVDGTLRDLEEDIDLDKNKKHNIEVIIDRIVIKEGISSRLYDSLETSLKLGDGKVIIDVIDQEELLFSEKFACPHCDFSVGDLEPRLFSFNSPFGACNECTGLGFMRKISLDLLIPDQTKSIAEGAIRAVENQDTYYFKILQITCEHYKIDINKPFIDLTEEEKHIVLFGSKDKIHFKFVSEGNLKHEKLDYYEGVVNNLERRYKETTSRFIRQWCEDLMADEPCPKCKGQRLSEEALSVHINKKNIYQFTQLSIKDALDFIESVQLSEKESQIAEMIFRQIKERLSFLVNVGLDYLALNRMAGTLSGGEGQRIRLATQIGSRLTGVLYVLDEPSIGLHQRDNDRLISTLKSMRDLGNTLIVVEHDEDTMLASDYLIDIGPGAGIHGGNVVSFGTPSEVMNDENSITGLYLSGRKYIPMPKVRRTGNGNFLEVIKASENNLKNINVKFPLGSMTVVTGVSGSGKSTLVNEILYKGLASKLYRTKSKAGSHKEILGYEHIEKIVDVDQSPIGRTPRSNPATYIGIFDHIRDLYAETNEAKIRGYQKGRFSFNVKGGRCEACQGDGVIKIEMNFLPDVYVPCEVCHGKRYSRETLEVKYKGKSIADVLEMTVEDALAFFENIPNLNRKLQTINDVGLGYIKLGQPATTLSGGEAQRVKLASELHKRITDKTLFILDEPTTGLHIDDVKRLIEVLQNIVDQGGTVVIIEHNLEVIKCADYIIDLGPEGGDKGGMVIATGTPEDIAKEKRSYTGKYIKKVLEKEKNR